MIFSSFPQGLLGWGVALSFVLFIQCATPGFPTGGERDKTPPKITSQYPPNEAVNVSTRKLVIEFDEFIQLQNPRQNLLISPPPKQFPDVSVKKNVLELTFKDDLEPNTTYALQFGDNIKDNNEGNALPEFKWVFSTGEYLDSIAVSGVLQTTAGKDIPDNTWVMLYTNLEDTAFTSQRPYYFSKVEKGTGAFRLDHLKAGTYKIYALTDKNGNYFFDLPTELIAFSDNAIVLTENHTLMGLKLFEPEPDRQYLVNYSTALKDDSWYLKFARPIPAGASWGLRPLSDSVVHRSRLSADRQSVTTWVQSPSPSAVIPWEITLSDTIFDTLYINHIIAPIKQVTASQSFGRTTSGLSQQSAQVIPATTSRGVWASEGDTILVSFSAPILAVIEDMVQLVKDTSQISSVLYAGLSADSLSIQLLTPVVAGNYLLRILPGGIRLFTTGENKDTLQYNTVIADTSTLGSLIIKMTLPADYQAIITIKSAQQQVFSVIVPDGEPEYVIRLPRQQAGKYTLEVIEDRDGNGQYSSGSYSAKRQPERIFISQPIELKAGWEQESELKVTFE
jgi:uncharacterized protein (DUF2141 family)